MLFLPSLAHTTSAKANLTGNLVGFPLHQTPPDPQQFAKASIAYKAIQDALRAKEAQDALIAQQQAQEAQIASQSLPALPGGSHTDWMSQAGIDPSNFGYVDYIVSHESGWNPSSVNSSSGACGIGQQLPCGKWAGAWNDPVAGLIAMQGYVNARYGGWAGAYSYWISHGNY